jgi:membrane-associated phospholipid phosphatase
MSTVTSGADGVPPALSSGIRAPLATAGVVGAVVAVTLGVVFAGQTTGSGLDAWAAAALELPHTSSSPAYDVSWIVQSLADPIPAVILMLLLGAACLRSGRGRLAVLAVAGPLAADMIVMVTKHITGRTIHNGSLTYPSTHTAQSAAFAMVTAMLIAALLRLDGGRAAVLVLGAAAVGALVMGWALVAGDVHYATDILGGLCVALAAVPAVAWSTDVVGDRIWPDLRSRTRA